MAGLFARSGDELHCFEAIGDEPLGFICVIPPLKP
jgi:hypothetical protein